jgi:hypothetical protein
MHSDLRWTHSDDCSCLHLRGGCMGWVERAGDRWAVVTRSRRRSYVRTKQKGMRWLARWADRQTLRWQSAPCYVPGSTSRKNLTRRRGSFG